MRKIKIILPAFLAVVIILSAMLIYNNFREGVQSPGPGLRAGASMLQEGQSGAVGAELPGGQTTAAQNPDGTSQQAEEHSDSGSQGLPGGATDANANAGLQGRLGTCEPEIELPAHSSPTGHNPSSGQGPSGQASQEAPATSPAQTDAGDSAAGNDHGSGSGQGNGQGNEQAESQGSDEQEGNRIKAPDFTVEDAWGNDVSLSDRFGKPIVLNFWASWCPPCRMEKPFFQEAFDHYGNEVKFIVLNIDEPIEVARGYADEEGFTFPLYFDEMNEGAAAFGVTGVPETFFINADGIVEARFLGAINFATIEHSIQSMLE